MPLPQGRDLAQRVELVEVGQWIIRVVKPAIQQVADKHLVQIFARGLLRLDAVIGDMQIGPAQSAGQGRGARFRQAQIDHPQALAHPVASGSARA